MIVGRGRHAQPPVQENRMDWMIVGEGGFQTRPYKTARTKNTIGIGGLMQVGGAGIGDGITIGREVPFIDTRRCRFILEGRAYHQCLGER